VQLPKRTRLHNSSLVTVELQCDRGTARQRVKEAAKTDLLVGAQAGNGTTTLDALERGFPPHESTDMDNVRSGRRGATIVMAILILRVGADTTDALALRTRTRTHHLNCMQLPKKTQLPNSSLATVELQDSGSAQNGKRKPFTRMLKTHSPWGLW
jgi:hypothetical protein